MRQESEMTHDEFEASAKKFCDKFNARLADTQDWNELEAQRESMREHTAEIHRLRVALVDGAMQRLTDVQQEMERKPLTEEEIAAAIDTAYPEKPMTVYDKRIARAIERAHGIGGEA